MCCTQPKLWRGWQKTINNVVVLFCHDAKHPKKNCSCGYLYVQLPKPTNRVCVGQQTWWIKIRYDLIQEYLQLSPFVLPKGDATDHRMLLYFSHSTSHPEVSIHWGSHHGSCLFAQLKCFVLARNWESVQTKSPAQREQFIRNETSFRNRGSYTGRQSAKAQNKSSSIQTEWNIRAQNLRKSIIMTRPCPQKCSSFAKSGTK